MIFYNEHNLQSGFSLFELSLVILIIGGIMSLAMPSWHALLNKQRLQQAAQGVRQMISTARHTALMLHSTVVLCPYQAGKHCGSAWAHGLMLGSVSTAEAPASGDPGTASLQVIKVWRALPAGWRLLWRSSLGKNSALVFQANGELLGQQGSFYIIEPDTKPVSGKQFDYAAKIIVSATGYVH